MFQRTNIAAKHVNNIESCPKSQLNILNIVHKARIDRTEHNFIFQFFYHLSLSMLLKVVKQCYNKYTKAKYETYTYKPK
jgi:hypothetical protein